jgi:hypothetical protein
MFYGGGLIDMVDPVDNEDFNHNRLRKLTGDENNNKWPTEAVSSYQLDCNLECTSPLAFLSCPATSSSFNKPLIYDFVYLNVCIVK